MSDRAIYEAHDRHAVLYDAYTWDGLKQAIIRDNESTHMYCPNITGIRLLIDDIEIQFPYSDVVAFINDLEASTNFIEHVEEDVKRFDREAV